MLQIGWSLVRSLMVSLKFFIDIKYFRSHCGPGVDSASDRNEYQEYFLGGKDGRCVRLINLQPPCVVVTKSGNLNFVEPSGTVQVCNGTALPFTKYGSRIPVGARFSASLQTGPGAHPASCAMGTGSFRGVKSARGVMLTSHPFY